MGRAGEDEGLEVRSTTDAQSGRAAMHTQQYSVPNGDGNLADVILGDYWWQMAGVDWLDGIDVPQDFVAGGHSDINRSSHIL